MSTPEYRKAHKKELAEKERNRHRANPEKYRAIWRNSSVKRSVGRWHRYSKEWRAANREKVLLTESARRARNKTKVIEILGGKCSWPGCDWTDPRALQVDHRNRADKKTHGCYERSGFELYRAIVSGKKPVSDFQLLCANHNWIKRFQNNEHGIQRG